MLEERLQVLLSRELRQRKVEHSNLMIILSILQQFLHFVLFQWLLEASLKEFSSARAGMLTGHLFSGFHLFSHPLLLSCCG
jgi:hypothetical protein